MSIKSSDLFAVGDEVQIKVGASAWMKEHNYWIADWPESIDGMAGVIANDYTQYAGNDCHYEVVIEGVTGCGVHPQWLTANAADLIVKTGESNCCHEDFICCGREMTPTGFQFGNGWECDVCGHREFDVASFKMGGNYEEYLRTSDNACATFPVRVQDQG
jgi:hypothetical protein